jgi:hypothetical protein
VSVLNTVLMIEKFGLFWDRNVDGAMSADCTMFSVPPFRGPEAWLWELTADWHPLIANALETTSTAAPRTWRLRPCRLTVPRRRVESLGMDESLLDIH